MAGITSLASLTPQQIAQFESLAPGIGPILQQVMQQQAGQAGSGRAAPPGSLAAMNPGMALGPGPQQGQVGSGAQAGQVGSAQAQAPPGAVPPPCPTCGQVMQPGTQPGQVAMGQAQPGQVAMGQAQPGQVAMGQAQPGYGSQNNAYSFKDQDQEA